MAAKRMAGDQQVGGLNTLRENAARQRVVDPQNLVRKPGNDLLDQAGRRVDQVALCRHLRVVFPTSRIAHTIGNGALQRFRDAGFQFGGKVWLPFPRL